MQGKESAATSEGVEVWVVRHGGRVDEVPGVRWDKSGKTNPHLSDPALAGRLDVRAFECVPFPSCYSGFPSVLFSPCLDCNVHDRGRDVAALARSVITIRTACCISDLCVRGGGGSRGVGG